MPSTPISQGVDLAIFWLFVSSLCVAWGGARLFLPPRKRMRRGNRSLSEIEIRHAYKLSKVRHRKSRQYKLIGITAMLAGSVGIFFAIKFVLESEF
jgi:hypothetical protein